MNSSLFVLALLSIVAKGAIAPAPTPAARLLEARQASAIYTVWSPTLPAGALSLSYEPWSKKTGDASLSVTRSSDYWAWCSTKVDCGALYTGCTSGTRYGPNGMEDACTVGLLCGTEYLYSTIGATARYTRPACWSDNTENRSYNFKASFYIASPAATSATSTFSSSSTFSSTPTSTSSSTIIPRPTPTQTPPPTPSPPIGAIVGGAIGGLVIVALTIIGVVFLIRRSRGSPNNNGPGASGNEEENAAPTNGEALKQQQHPLLVEQGGKSGVVASVSPVSPPPQYQSPMMQGSANIPELGSHSVTYGGAAELPVSTYQRS